MLFLITSASLPTLLFVADDRDAALAMLANGMNADVYQDKVRDPTFVIRPATIDEIAHLIAADNNGEAMLVHDSSF